MSRTYSVKVRVCLSHVVIEYLGRLRPGEVRRQIAPDIAANVASP